MPAVVAKGYCLDASALIEAWGSVYPPAVFPTLWQQLKRHKDKLTIIKPILDEIKPGHGGLREWLDSNGFSATEKATSQKAKEVADCLRALKNKYETPLQGTKTKGAGATDMELIAYSKINHKTVVTQESRQKENPSKKRNYKIPLVCDKEEVVCITFIEMLEELGVKI